MQTDIALELLLPWLQNPSASTLWFADENALSILDAIQANPNLTMVTNRYDIYSIANCKNINTIFSDFNKDDYKTNTFAIVVYRISKEKALVNHILQQACTLVNKGRLIFSGLKQDGIKTYSDKLKKTVETEGKLQKKGAAYLGNFQFLSTKTHSEYTGEPYHTLQKIHSEHLATKYFYSKPGVFGWNKIDKGTDLLLAQVRAILTSASTKDKNALDLGCGYGWIFLNLDIFGFHSITATDNNAAALLASEANKDLIKTPVNVVKSDCADTIEGQFDFLFCNPPFHQGFKHSQGLTQKFIQACRKKLNKTGKAYFVVNEFVATDDLFETNQLKAKHLIKQSGFKVFLIEHQQ